MQKVKVGVIGCGQVSATYLRNCTTMFHQLEVAGCADIEPARARARADEFGLQAYGIDELLEHTDIEVILNLTAPAYHAEVNLKALSKGKHVYSEKPFALSMADAEAVLKLAEERGLLVGCAPDTFLGGGLQTGCKLVADGWIGKPYAAHASIWMGNFADGMHPNFHNFFRLGGDPLLDMGPYYITALVALLGPVKRVLGMAGQLQESITVQNPQSPRYGEQVQVAAPMNAAACLEFHSGVLGSLQAAKEGFGYFPRLELYGTAGNLILPDPNFFGGPIIWQGSNGEVKEMPCSHSFTAESRGLGLADLAEAIREDRQPRASGQLASHVLAALLGVLDSASTGQAVAISTACEKPPALPLGLKYGWLGAKSDQ